MKITQVVCQILRVPNVRTKTDGSQDSVLIRIRTDNGLEGIGEADSSPEVVKAIVDAPLSHELTHEKLQAQDGWIDIPDGPGLGITLNEDFVRSTLIAESS